MKALILAAASVVALSAAAHADAIVTEKTESGVYSAPVAGATPQARENPAPDTTMGEIRRKTTVEEVPSTTVIERRSAEPDVEVRTRSQY